MCWYKNMLKIINNNLSNIRRRIDCTPYLDCSAHDAAQVACDEAEAALEEAENNLSNARELQSQLEQEKATTQELLNNYESVYDTLSAVGSTVANPNNMGEMSSMIECISNYGSNVEAACNQAKTEVSRCLNERNLCARRARAARETLANTPCVWECA